MSEYTSTREGFQRAMEWSLQGNPEEAKSYAEATSLPTFYHQMNGRRLAYDDYVKGIVEWRGKVSEYKPVVHEFLRDGDQLAARMTGTIKVSGSDTQFESFMFGKVDKATGKMEWLVERSVWGPAGGALEHGVN
ncbi:uncharacterized protein F4822DRAFT_431471 [Hypoxylon trugodes]|uniref:uncharacterized protein n=1 Tax=Hypoxylon trugodes TaxID=326681 RepID=UPI00219E9BC5|nr:uncharacterized protein F4822DRAFT_431471 [Hypoxylon trugodes]KAI1386601.1 hypothetical protein F4822DRAFT_431471 [Hypoxylon trugodes]